MNRKCEISVNGLKYSVAHYITGHPKCGRLHGHTYTVDVTVADEKRGEFNFVGDVEFGEFRAKVMEILNKLDHHILVPGLDYRGQGIIMSGEKRYIIPEEDIFVVSTPSTSAEDMAGYICRKLCEVFRVAKMTVLLHEGPTQSASYTFENV